jgi:4-amino-4-deoxy-L-arabinose transferase-like glycosyltransferase
MVDKGSVTEGQTYSSRADRDGLADDPVAGARQRSRLLLVLFLLFLGLAAVLRAPTFSDRVFNSDEAYLATQAQVLVDGGRLYVDTVDRKPPVVPYLYAAVFRLTGSDDLAPVRALAVLAHVLTALLLALEARRRFRWRWAALFTGCAYLLAASAFHPADAQAANFEVFMLPVMTGALLLGIRNRPAAAGATLGLATLTKQTAAFAILPLAWLAWRARRWGGLALLTTAFAGAILVAAVVFGPRDFFFWVFTGNGGYLDPQGVLGYALALGARETGWFVLGSAALLVLLPSAWGHRRADRDLWLWLLSGLFAVFAGLRFFPHYYLQLLPPLTLLAVRGLDSRARAAGRLVLASVAVVAIASAAYFVVPAFTEGNNRDTRVALDVASYIRRHTHAGQRVMVWGQAPDVYWASNRRPAIRFATTGFVTGTSGGRPPDHVGTQYAVPGAWRDLVVDLRRTPPVLIANMSTANQRHAGEYPPRKFPKFQHYLDAGGWHRVALVDGVEILRQTR